jgi:hypothetical protein
MAALLARQRSRLVAIASRSGAFASHSARMMAFENKPHRRDEQEREYERINAA